MAMARTAGFVPAARSSGLVITESADELLVHDQARRAMHRLDPVAAAIWKSCDGWRTIADLGRSCACVLGSPISDDTAIETLAMLEQAGLLEPPSVSMRSHDPKPSRSQASGFVPIANGAG